MSDAVEHPAHYLGHSSGVEAIDVCEHLSFNLGNAVKYLWRRDRKGATLEDLRKSAWYLRREVDRRHRVFEKRRLRLGLVTEADDGVLGGVLSLLLRADAEETAYVDDALVMVELEIARLEKKEGDLV